MRELRTITKYGLTVEIASDGIWFTVYDADDRVAGTIVRPHMFQKDWRAYNRDGDCVAKTIGPNTCMMKLHKSRTVQAA